jgi:hypothetical protein
MVQASLLVPLLLLATTAIASPDGFHAELVNLDVKRTVDLRGQVEEVLCLALALARLALTARLAARRQVFSNIEVRNDGARPTSVYLVAIHASRAGNLSYLLAADDNGDLKAEPAGPSMLPPAVRAARDRRLDTGACS